MKSGTFSKRSGADTKGFESCEFWFQAAFFNLNTALYFLEKYVCMEENNLKNSLALYIRLAFRNIVPCHTRLMMNSSIVCLHFITENNQKLTL